MHNMDVIPAHECANKMELKYFSLFKKGIKRDFFLSEESNGLAFVKSFICFLCLLGFMLLNGCSTTTVKQNDGPPPFDVDVSQIPNAVPKCEPLSKYGNMSNYHVFGKKYKVMKSAKHYRERGIASWYGMKFDKHNTSSGEPYNLLAMTAAHKTLPLPTYVEVTNLSNKRNIIVKVNDRGPFAPNRIIDLSYVAAKKLGMLGHGTALVEVRAIDPAEAYRHPNLLAHHQPKPTHYVMNPSQPGVYLQVGAFKNRRLAENLKKRISPLTAFPIHITQSEKKSTLFKVRIGPIKDIATADYISKKLRQIGLHAEHKMV